MRGKHVMIDWSTVRHPTHVCLYQPLQSSWAMLFNCQGLSRAKGQRRVVLMPQERLGLLWNGSSWSRLFRAVSICEGCGEGEVSGSDPSKVRTCADGVFDQGGKMTTRSDTTQFAH
jgi:hypothetical protein